MYGTSTINLGRPAESNDLNARLNWLLAVNAEEARRLSRLAAEDEVLLMSRPLDTRRAIGLFGLMLGLFPPAAIFIKMFSYGLAGRNISAMLFVICLLMNLTCAAAGYGMGKALSRAVENLERRSLSVMMLLIPLIGIAWGAATGFAGGLVFLGIGALLGPIYAMPVGALSFTLFVPLHRALARDGMIDARHFWPLASGASLFPAALVLGM